jgi:DNA-binding NarL/FixJ family response regulator
MALDRTSDADQLIVEATPAADRWGTALVLGEVARSRALLDSAAGQRRQLRLAEKLLGQSAAQVEIARSHLALYEGEHDGTHTQIAPTSVFLRIYESPRGSRTLLSPRVHQVAEQVAAGKPNREIAAELGITPATVSRHVSTALHLTGTRNRTELAAYMGYR